MFSDHDVLLLYMGDNFNPYSLYSDPNDRLIIEFPISKTKVRSENEVASVLILLTELYLIIYKYRLEGDIKPLINYPRGANERELADFSRNIDKKKAAAGDIAATIITERYNLSSAWLIPFFIATLTNHLPLQPDSGVKIYLPGIIGGIEDLKRSFITSRSLVIEIIRHKSLDEIKQYLDDNKNIINRQLRLLPSRPKTKMSKRVEFWGSMSEIVRNANKKMTWNKTLNFIKNGELSPSTIKTAPDTGEELRLIHRDFLKEIVAFDNRGAAPGTNARD